MDVHGRPADDVHVTLASAMRLPRSALPSLELLPALLQVVVEGVAEDHLRRRPAAGGFAVVEHVWHLADLEVEGYGVRIERLLREEDPELEDFDGEAVARERRYDRLDAGPEAPCPTRASPPGRFGCARRATRGSFVEQRGEFPLVR